MPRPCAVEAHARSYKKNVEEICGCHGLVPWRLTLVAKAQEFIAKNFKRETPRREAVASSRVVPFLRSGERETPRREAAASSRVVRIFLCSGERETPRRKAVASPCSEPQNRWICDTLPGFYKTC